MLAWLPSLHRSLWPEKMYCIPLTLISALSAQRPANREESLNNASARRHVQLVAQTYRGHMANTFCCPALAPLSCQASILQSMAWIIGLDTRQLSWKLVEVYQKIIGF